MNDQFMPCGLDDDRLYDQADAIAAARSSRVYDHADHLLDQCESLAYATQLDREWELYETPLLANMMKTIADWSGRTDGPNGSAEQMRKLHVILFEQIRETISEQEVQA